MQTIILGMTAFNVQHTKNNISKAMLKMSSKFGIIPRAEFIEYFGSTVLMKAVNLVSAPQGARVDSPMHAFLQWLSHTL